MEPFGIYGIQRFQRLTEGAHVLDAARQHPEVKRDIPSFSIFCTTNPESQLFQMFPAFGVYSQLYYKLQTAICVKSRKVNTPAHESRGTGENEPLVRRSGAGIPTRMSQ
jgi:hypothetical protein